MAAGYSPGFFSTFALLKKAYSFKKKEGTVAVLLAVVLWCSACVQKSVKDEPSPQAEQSKISELARYSKLMQDGDIVLRTGTDVTSNMFRMLNQKDATYSHCGIFFRDSGVGYVVHCIGGEDNPGATIRKERLDLFIASTTNEGFGVCRYALSANELARLKNFSDSMRSSKLKFDLKFDLATDTTMYCAEFVYKAFGFAKNNPQCMGTSTVRGFRYVAVDDVFSATGATMVCKVKY